MSIIVPVTEDDSAVLRANLPTWLAVHAVDEVVLLDWRMTKPLQTLKHDLPHLSDPRVRILRMNDHHATFVKSHANNLLLQASRGAFVLRIDATTALDPRFVSAHPLKANTVYRGNYQKARNSHEAMLNPNILAPRDVLRDARGWDDRLIGYGFEDTDLYSRLELLGSTLIDINYDYMKHVSNNVSRNEMGDFFSERLNVRLTATLSQWHLSSGRFSCEMQESHGACICSHPSLPPTHRDILEPEAYNDAVMIANSDLAWKVINSHRKDVIFVEINKGFLKHRMARMAAAFMASKLSSRIAVLMWDSSLECKDVPFSRIFDVATVMPPGSIVVRRGEVWGSVGKNKDRNRNSNVSVVAMDWLTDLKHAIIVEAHMSFDASIFNSSSLYPYLQDIDGAIEFEHAACPTESVEDSAKRIAVVNTVTKTSEEVATTLTEPASSSSLTNFRFVSRNDTAPVKRQGARERRRQQQGGRMDM